MDAAWLWLVATSEAVVRFAAFAGLEAFDRMLRCLIDVAALEEGDEIVPTPTGELLWEVLIVASVWICAPLFVVACVRDLCFRPGPK